MLVEYDLSPQQIASHTNVINNDNLKHGNHFQPRSINIHHQTYNALRLWHRRSKTWSTTSNLANSESCGIGWDWELINNVKEYQDESRLINQALKSPVPPGNGADNGRQQPAASASAARGERSRRLAAMSNQGHVNLVKFPKGRDICEHLHENSTFTCVTIKLNCFPFKMPRVVHLSWSPGASLDGPTWVTNSYICPSLVDHGGPMDVKWRDQISHISPRIQFPHWTSFLS